MRSLLSVEEYQSRVLAGIFPLAPKRVALASAYGCVPAAELTAPNDLPPFPSSAMDGFALRSADTSGASTEVPVTLQLAGEVQMGRPAEVEVAEGQAAAVATGGMMPPGADAVVPIELCQVAQDGVILTVSVAAGRNVRPAGEDLRRGEVLAPAGRRMQAADLGALAAAGFAEVEVRTPPRVVIVSTGDELVPPGIQPGPGQINESNSFLLRGLVRRAGAEAAYAGRVPDDPSALLEALSAAVTDADLIVCSGGVSAGLNDPVKRAFAAEPGVSCVQVAVQPGRPQAFGSWLGKPFFGLPGNPMAALVGFELFVRPALRMMMGLDPAMGYLHATFEGSLDSSLDCVRYVPVRLTSRGPELVACALGSRRSNQLAALARADGLAEVPRGTGLEDGDACRVFRIREE